MSTDKELIQKYLEPDRPSYEWEKLSTWIDEPMLSAVLSCSADDVRDVAHRIRAQMQTIIAELDRQSDRMPSASIATRDREIVFEVKTALGMIGDNKKLGAAQRLHAFELLRENQ